MPRRFRLEVRKRPKVNLRSTPMGAIHRRLQHCRWRRRPHAAASPPCRPGGCRRFQGCTICACGLHILASIPCGPSTGSRSGSKRVSSLKIMAPLAGWCASLDEVPDEVFAGRMLGDGLAIDPTTGVVIAPCAGEIIALPASAHAVSIRTPDGVDVLIHVGIDTVELQGRGFQACVKPGAAVRAGDELIRFDLDVVARGAKSLMTPIVVAPIDGVTISRRRAEGPVFAGDVLFEINGSPARSSDSAKNGVSQTLTVSLRQGLHARPAALLAHRAKPFKVTLAAHGRSANARSVVAIMALGVRHGDAVTILASGGDATQAIAGVLAGIEEAMAMDTAAGHGSAPPAADAAAPAVSTTSG